MSGLQNGKTIFDVYENIGSTREQIKTLDQSLINGMSKNSKEIIQTIKSWQSDTSSAISNAVNSAVSRVSGGGGGGSGNTTKKCYNICY